MPDLTQKQLGNSHSGWSKVGARLAAGTGTQAAGSKSARLLHHHVPDTITQNRSVLVPLQRPNTLQLGRREPEEVFLVDHAQHGGHGSLDDLVFECCDRERALAAVFLRNVAPAGRLRPVRSCLDPCVQVLDTSFEALFVGLPRHAVDAGGLVTLQRIERCLPIRLSHTRTMGRQKSPVSMNSSRRSIHSRRRSVARPPAGEPPFHPRARTFSAGLGTATAGCTV